MKKYYLEDQGEENMKNKKIICVASLIALSITAVALMVSTANSDTLPLNYLNVGAVNEWREKAYERPTGQNDGYKHYYLGCPGNVRASDPDGHNIISLDDIIIDRLDEVTTSAIDPNDKILSINSGSITNFDQDGPTYVIDQTYESLFFSRSNKLDGVDPVLSSFSFDVEESADQDYLGTVTFDYKYLDYNTTLGPVHSDHIYTTYYNGSDDVYHDFEFVNDDTWHSATIAINAENAESFAIKIYDLQGHFYISNLAFTSVWDNLGLESATLVDTVERTNLSDLGLEDGPIPEIHDGHLFGTYDFNTKKALDLWFKLEYEKTSNDKYALFYLFNNHDESGIVFRFQFNRSEDDGIVPLYIFTNMEHQEGNTVVTGAGNAGTFFYLPRISGVKSSTDAVLHFTAYCIDEATNKYRCAFTAGVDEDSQYYPSTNPEDKTNTEKTFDIVLGSTYFDNGTHRSIRISSTVADNAAVTDIGYTDTKIQTVYKDIDGNIVGKNTNATISTPKLEPNGKTFLGWFDSDGNRVADGTEATGILVLTPRVVNNQTNMFTLSDYGFNTASNWINIDSDTHETPSQYGQSANEGEAIDLYFIYEVTSCPSGDNYFIFGFPFDTIDGNSRAIIRMDEYVGNTTYRGYISGGSLGSAGRPGTSFASSSGLVSNTRLNRTLVHLRYSVVDVNTISLTLELTNLATWTSFSVTKETKFTADFNVTSEYLNRNKFAIIRPVGEAQARITDAF